MEASDELAFVTPGFLFFFHSSITSCRAVILNFEWELPSFPVIGSIASYLMLLYGNIHDQKSDNIDRDESSTHRVERPL